MMLQNDSPESRPSTRTKEPCLPKPLSGAELRITWAAKRLEELQALITKYAEAERAANDVTSKFYPGGRLEIRLSDMSQPPPEIGLVLGEVVNHLRSALDYLIYELARLDSGSPQDFTQFPVEETEKDFARSAKSRLKGPSAKHVRAIEELQPYRSGFWALDLQMISNPDKHRGLIGTRSSQSVQAMILIGSMEDIANDPGVPKAIEDDPAGRYIKFQHHVEDFTVSFGEGQPEVLIVANVLFARVSEAVASFRPCFEGSCMHPE